MSGAPAPAAAAAAEVVLDRSLPPYVGEKYVCTRDTLKATLDRYGVAVIHNVLSAADCEAMLGGMWDFLEHATSRFPVPIKRGVKATWAGLNKLYPMHSMLIQQWGIGHAQFLWDVRQNANVLANFSEIWGVTPEELLVSFDGASVHMPPETTKSGWFAGSPKLHTGALAFINVARVRCVGMGRSRG